MEKYKRLKAIAHKDTVIGHFVAATIRILRHYISQVVLSALGTVAIAVLIGFQFDTFFLWITVLMYLILQFGICACQDYEKSLQEDIKDNLESVKEKYSKIEKQLKETQHLVHSMTVLQMSAGKNIYRVAKHIKHNGWYYEISQLREVFGFQRMCMEVCREIYDVCKDMKPDFTYYITVFQKIENHQMHKNTCRMIAYSNQDGSEPLSFHTIYDLQKISNGVKEEPFHNVILANQEAKPRILIGAKDIRKHFIWHPENKTREESIQAYIGIPVAVCNRQISFLLQIDCNNERGFGDNAEATAMFAEQIIRPYALYLSMIYEFDRMNEVTDSYIAIGKGEDWDA